MLDQLKSSPRWQELFKHCESPSCCVVPDGCEDRVAARLRSAPLDLVRLDDVVEIIACYDGERVDRSFIGIFELRDGRSMSIRGWFYDFTGGNVEFADGESFVAKNISDIIQYGLTQEERVRFPGLGRMAI